VVVNKILIIFLIFVKIFFTKFAYSYEIYDYETEFFLDKLIKKVINVNNFNKKINIKIIKDNNPNAFVIAKNQLIISSGLIEQCPDYVCLLGVLAHEIGHLENLHLEKRKDSIEYLSNFKLVSDLALISGLLITGNPEVLGAAIANQASINSYYLGFTKDQEREADYYSIRTLNRLDLPSESMNKFLKILEKNLQNKGLDEHYQKFSTHPIFKERFEIIENNKKLITDKYSLELNDEFNFIKAKFLAHNNNFNLSNLQDHHIIYYESIKESKIGNLPQSLKKINFLIKKFPRNIYLLETKADILRSHGFANEAIKFYNIVFKDNPSNKYVKLRIFVDTNSSNLNHKSKKDFFYDNLVILKFFPYNKYVINKFKQLSSDLQKNDWTDFFNLINKSNSISKEIYFEELDILYQKTNNIKLKETIRIFKKI
tara:strand:- start:113 stop:1396 length:1284 start_codon:yes stop_codon:yes gene_type:complete